MIENTRTVLIKVMSVRALHKIYSLIGYDTATFYAPKTKQGIWLYFPKNRVNELVKIKGIKIVRERNDLRRHWGGKR